MLLWRPSSETIGTFLSLITKFLIYLQSEPVQRVKVPCHVIELVVGLLCYTSSTRYMTECPGFIALSAIEQVH